MKISGESRIATIPELTDLTKQRISYSESYIEIDPEIDRAMQYTLTLLKDDTAIEIIPAQFTMVKFMHLKARFPAAARVATVGLKLQKTGGAQDTDYHDFREYLIGGEADIISCEVANNEVQVRLLKLVETAWHTLIPADVGKVVAYLGGAPAYEGICLAYDNVLRYIWVLTLDLFDNISTAITVDGDTSSLLDAVSALDGEDAMLDIILVGK